MAGRVDLNPSQYGHPLALHTKPLLLHRAPATEQTARTVTPLHPDVAAGTTSDKAAALR